MIYLDHAATTPLEPEVLEAMLPWLKGDGGFASASSLHTPGRRAAEAIEEARERVARLLGAKADEVFFTSGGSEANNWAIFGAVEALGKKRRDRIVASSIEHHSVLEPCEALARRGCEVTLAGVDAEGVINLARLEEAMGTEGSGTALVCVMHANNEIGTIEPVEAVGRLARARGAHFHVDAVQTAGHVPVDVKTIGCDTLAISAHKLGGPKGVGALYVRKGVELGRLIHGGGQERGRRAGTQNVAGIVRLGQAAELAVGWMKEEAGRLAALRDRLIAGIEARVSRAKLNGPRARRLPGNVNFAFEGIESGELLMRLDMGGICASAGSACTSGALEPSHVLLAIGLAPELAHGALRLTLGRENTETDVDRSIELVAETVERMRES